jgi:hypothetical protein
MLAVALGEQLESGRCWSVAQQNDQTQEELEDTKEVIRMYKSNDRQHNCQTKKDKQRSTNHYTEN